jgi:glycerol kinase
LEGRQGALKARSATGQPRRLACIFPLSFKATAFSTLQSMSSVSYILALDQGTTSSRAIAFDHAGRVCASAQKEFRQIFPQPGWVEHDANEIWASQLQVAKDLIQKLAVAGENTAQAATKIVAIGITNQRETTVLWDRATGEPLHHAIVWQDRRTAARCDELKKAGKAVLIQRKTGLVLDAYFSGTKLAWLLDHVPSARERAEKGELCFGTVDAWLIYKLTGGKVHATDASNASRTLLFNLHTMAWDDELLRLFNVPRSVLPHVMPSCGVVGTTEANLFGVPIPIAGIAGDQQAATFGQACFAPGMAKNTYGTGCFMLMNTGDAAVTSKNKLLTTVAWKGPGNSAPAYALEGSVFMAGATIQWLRDGLKIINAAPEVEALAASVQDTGDVYLVPAFAGLGTPHWDGYARGTLLGMTRGTTLVHIARAALESIALQVADVFEAMRADSGIALKELRVDGGASNNNLLMQMQADFLGVPVVRPKVTETTALGAAYLAGLGVGFWQSGKEIAAQWQVDQRFEPRMKPADRQAKLARWREAVERSKGWARD